VVDETAAAEIDDETAPSSMAAEEHPALLDGPGPPSPPSLLPGQQPPDEPGTRGDRRALIAAAVAVLLVAGITAFVLTRSDDSGASADTEPTQSAATPTPSPTDATQPTAPTGEPLPENVLIVTSQDPATQEFTVYQVNTDTGERARVTDVETSALGPRLPVISVDRTTYMYLRGEDTAQASEVIVQEFGNPAAHPLLTDSSPCPGAKRPASSPDGSQLALTCVTDGRISGAAVVDLEGQGELLDVGGVLPYSGGTWAEGDFVYEAADPNDTDASLLYALPVDGSGEPRAITPSDGNFHSGADWNDVGGFVYVVGESNTPPGDIVVDPPGAPGPEQLTDTGLMSNPTWSPDGTRIAYLEERGNGRYTLWVMDANGDNALRLKVPGIAGPPAWGTR
jgi:hypothetical protein